MGRRPAKIIGETALTAAPGGGSHSIGGEYLLTTALDQVQTIDDWIEYGRSLGRMDRMVKWEIGDWWNRGERYGQRVEIVTSSDWTGPSHGTCRNAGSVAAKFDVSRRHDTLTFEHHAKVAKLLPGEADELLQQTERQTVETGKTPPTRMLGQIVKQRHRSEREQQMGDATRRQSSKIGTKLYSVILADPPWRFEVWSNESGMDRAADNHYPTMALEDICTLQVPAADDCVLFLWRTASAARKAYEVLEAWGFEYRTEIIWEKQKIGTGYWVRDKHEVLMIASKGHPVAPAPGTQPYSVIKADTGRHSKKPEAFYEIIEKLYPTADKLELFARTPREGWDRWGNEA
jgi:N6-adenosine-specific RNA methylase IME4